MTSPSQHPSRLQLDRLALSASASSHEDEHLAQCGECTTYVEAARRSSKELASAVVPGWVRELERPTVRTPRLVGFGLAAAAGVLLVSTLLPHREAPYVGTKGDPSIALYVRTPDGAVAWDAKPLAVGTAVRLEAQPSGYVHLTLFEHEHAHWTVLDERDLVPHTPSLLPKAWELEASSTDVTFVAVFSRARLSDAEKRVVRTGGTPRGSAVKRVSIPVRGPSDGRP